MAAGKRGAQSGCLPVRFWLTSYLVLLDIVRNFKERCALLRPSVLRDGLKAMTTCAEAFFNLRQHFGRTLSTMNACHYILGIGDRHLSNSMVDLQR